MRLRPLVHQQRVHQSHQVGGAGRGVRDACGGENLFGQSGQRLPDRGLGRERLSKLSIVSQLEQERAAGGLSIRASCHVLEDVRCDAGRLMAMK